MKDYACTCYRCRCTWTEQSADIMAAGRRCPTCSAFSDKIEVKPVRVEHLNATFKLDLQFFQKLRPRVQHAQALTPTVRLLALEWVNENVSKIGEKLSLQAEERLQ